MFCSMPACQLNGRHPLHSLKLVHCNSGKYLTPFGNTDFNRPGPVCEHYTQARWMTQFLLVNFMTIGDLNKCKGFARV